MTLITPIIQRWIDEGRRDPEALWARAADDLPWFRRWDRVFEWDPPTFRWFVGGQTNLGFNAVDRHVLDGHGGRAALIYFNERGERVVQTYAQLLHEVKRIAAALRGLGIGKGDRITIYMPPCPESIALMLATVRIGAIHSIVFAGFGAQALVTASRPAVRASCLPTDVTYRKGKTCRCCRSSSEALQVGGGSVERVVVLDRGRRAARRIAPSWDDFLRGGDGHDSGHGSMESNEPAFILATSGTTATPKLAIHTHGGYQVHVVTHGQMVLRPPADRRVVGDVGYRLDRRPQLHGVRAAARRLHHHRVRGRARLPAGQRELARGGRGVRRHRHLHFADRRPHADALRRRAAALDRSLPPRAHRLCR